MTKRRTLSLGEGITIEYPAPTTPSASAIMRANRKFGTRPETAIRCLAHRRGLRYRLGATIRIGARTIRPDLVFRKTKVAVFVDGCFWHGCPAHGTRPRSNANYWAQKIGRNVSRDRLYDSVLQDAGWKVIRIWEHEDPESAMSRVLKAVQASKRTTIPAVCNDGPARQMHRRRR